MSYPLVAGSWGAAAAAVAATRAAAVSCAAPMQPMHGAPNTAAAGANPLSAADAAMPAHAPLPRVAVAMCPADSLKCWLAGISDTSVTSADDLTERLRAALPETYED